MNATTLLPACSFNRWPLYAAANMVFLLLVGVLAASGDAAQPRVLYLVLLFAMCSLPIALAERLNGRYTILSVFLALYFLFYGAGDVTALLEPGLPGPARGMLTAGESLILAGGALFVFGYCMTANGGRQLAQAFSVKDWPDGTIVMLGLLLWGAGTGATWYWQVHVIVRRSVEMDDSIGGGLISLLVLARMLQPLGILILAYGLTTAHRRALLPLIVAVVGLQVIIGLVGDSKELAMRAGIFVVLTIVLVEGRLPKMWLGLGVAFVILAFPVFQAYRTEVVGARGLSNAQAAQQLGKAIAIALQSTDKVSKGLRGHERAQSFVERATLKGSIELLIAKTGKEVAFQNGYTLTPLFGAFIPRMIWADKRDSGAGQLFNRAFHISEDPDTYISPSHLGELYWNFGWLGVLLGMPAIGLLLGWINRSCDLSQQRSVTRLLVLATTIYFFCVRFEGSIATDYIVWIRSLAVVWLLHLMFARLRGTPAAPSLSPSSSPSRPFPNLLR